MEYGTFLVKMHQVHYHDVRISKTNFIFLRSEVYSSYQSVQGNFYAHLHALDRIIDLLNDTRITLDMVN